MTPDVRLHRMKEAIVEARIQIVNYHDERYRDRAIEALTKLELAYPVSEAISDACHDRSPFGPNPDADPYSKKDIDLVSRTLIDRLTVNILRGTIQMEPPITHEYIKDWCDELAILILKVLYEK